MLMAEVAAHDAVICSSLPMTARSARYLAAPSIRSLDLLMRMSFLLLAAKALLYTSSNFRMTFLATLYFSCVVEAVSKLLR